MKMYFEENIFPESTKTDKKKCFETISYLKINFQVQTYKLKRINKIYVI